jgi:hypothetical protein
MGLLRLRWLCDGDVVVGIVGMGSGLVVDTTGTAVSVPVDGTFRRTLSSRVTGFIAHPNIRW